ncbi:uncharacterized protein PHACADRAFT_201927 [Phanerochaete carnosa HHB-10118-sp]|uniref:Uncharacterized protein n=1 Tax=Phanerochaete carnosa (strain HHB-10118-sp) TaxID=650164 RepID=K5VR12_PHACS|nr:uncharacterized protein PHACADRAFT_201927 [Phanerochaete carnosa HHB-10118-sp]EKM49180.1 hypothetical protein PHACADRAFT_201927 [Phanerochaete carnosa HHB-10118-sp]
MSITHHRQHQYGLQLPTSEVKDLQEEFLDNQEVEVEVDHLKTLLIPDKAELNAIIAENSGILPENAGNLGKQEEEEPTEEEETREAEAKEVEETGETTKAIHLQIAPTFKSLNGTEIQALLICQQSATQFQ